MLKRRTALSLGAALVLVGSSAFATSQAQASPTPELQMVTAAADPSSAATYEQLAFAHPVSLESAVTVTEGAGVPISGYHFESDSIVGDFWPNSGLSVEEFLAEVAAKTATAPEVVGAYVDADLYAESTETSRSIASPILGEDLPIYDAPDADPSLDTFDSEETSSDTSRRVAADETWHPSEAEVMIGPMGNNLSISAKYRWQTTDPFSSALVMADHWGMEFQIDFYSSRALPSDAPLPGTRPLCGTSITHYKDWAAASNREFDWFGWVIAGPDLVAAPGTLGLYGDYNDLTDPCKVSTIAVGMAQPHAMPYDTMYKEHLSLYMYPLKGSEAQSKVGAIVQPVTRQLCEQIPNMPLTDCMGVVADTYPGPGPSSNRMVLNSANNNQAPSLCWYSPDFGTTPAQTWAC